MKLPEGGELRGCESSGLCGGGGCERLDRPVVGQSFAQPLLKTIAQREELERTLAVLKHLLSASCRQLELLELLLQLALAAFQVLCIQDITNSQVKCR